MALQARGAAGTAKRRLGRFNFRQGHEVQLWSRSCIHGEAQLQYSHNEYGNDISIIHMEMIFPYEMWEWDSNITYGNVIPILYMGMSFQLQIPISYMGILFPHEIGEWPTIINFASKSDGR